MMLTTRGRYAVMAVLDIALNSNGRTVILSDIATRQNIALSYLEQIFVRLRKAGIVASVRGPNGGYLLTKSASDITIDQIIDAVDESIEMTRCKRRGGGCMPSNAKCRAHDLWEGLGDEIRRYFANISLQIVMDGGILHDLS